MPKLAEYTGVYNFDISKGSTLEKAALEVIVKLSLDYSESSFLFQKCADCPYIGILCSTFKESEIVINLQTVC